MRDIKIRTIILIWIGIMICVGELPISYDDAMRNNGVIEAALTSIMLIILMIIGRVKLKLIKEKVIEFKEKVSLKEIIFLLVLGMIFSEGSGLISEGITYLINPGYAIKILESSSENINGIIQLVMYLIGVSFIVPIVEEVIFRRIFFIRLSKRFGIISGMIISSVVFGMIHYKFSIIGAIVFGITCCILYKKYGNLIANISLHILNNGICGLMTIVYYFNGTTNDIYTTIDVKSNLIIGIPLTIISLVIFIIYFRKNKRFWYK